MPILNPELDIKAIVSSALEKTGVPELSPSKSFRASLEAQGINLDSLGVQLADIIFNGKLGVRRQAILDAAALFGADIRENAAPQTPTVVINIMSDESKVQQIFAPER